jgi:ATP-dependent Clp protease adapter protein ClpS
MTVSGKVTLEPQVEENSSAQVEGLYHVIILNDEDHTIDYVVEMLQATVGPHGNSGAGMHA